MKKIYHFNNYWIKKFKDPYRQVGIEAETILEAKKKPRIWGFEVFRDYNSE